MDNKYVVEVTGEDGLTELMKFSNKLELFDRFRDVEIDFEGFTDILFYTGEVQHGETYRLLTGLPYQEEVCLVKYHEAFGYGELEGLFICTQEELESLSYATIDFGEALGKHSDVSSYEVSECCTVITRDPDVIRDLEVLFGTKDLSGINPLDYLSEQEEEEDDEC